jgi:hypothetical protein
LRGSKIRIRKDAPGRRGWCSGFGDWGSGLMVEGLEFRAQGLEFREFRV